MKKKAARVDGLNLESSLKALALPAGVRGALLFRHRMESTSGVARHEVQGVRPWACSER